jgi:hypothetical protein
MNVRLECHTTHVKVEVLGNGEATPLGGAGADVRIVRRRQVFHGYGFRRLSRLGDGNHVLPDKPVMQTPFVR